MLIKNPYSISSESATDSGFEYETPDLTNKDEKGYETDRSLEDYLGYNPDLGLTRDDELSKGEFEDFFRDPKVMEKFAEYMDMTDNDTRKYILNMNEAEHNSLLTSLTSKLYDKIVSKVDDIDYGDIPLTKGDLTKLPNYEKLCDCIQILKDILKEYRQDTGPIDEISTAIGNITGRKEMFGRAFRMNVELPIVMYNNTVLSIINGVSYMISTSIEFIKTPNRDSFQIVLDRMGYNKTKHAMIYGTLKKFNKSCAKGEFDKAMEHVIAGSRNMREGVLLATISVAVVLLIIPILKEMVFLFYYLRMRVSEFFDVQADLLQMNAYNVQNSVDLPENEKERIVQKQFKIVDFFKNIANKISIKNKKAESDANKDIISDSKMTIDNVNSSGTSVLF